MRPAFSVICFSVLSGAGYGLLGSAGVFVLLGPECSVNVCANMALPPDAQAAFFAAVVLFAMTLVIAGLGASVLHLGRPERVWRAFSQWRTSWLSREGVAASASLIAAGIWAALLWSGQFGLDMRIAATATLSLAAITVFCTARIYTSLPPIPAWRGNLVLPGYLLFAATTGLALWLLLARALIGIGSPAVASLLGAFALATAAVKWRYWREVDAISLPTTGAMTGLDRIGETNSFEGPHTEPNYLTKEMGFRFARRHSQTLRAAVIAALIAIAAIAAAFFVVPALSAHTPQPWLVAMRGNTPDASVSSTLLVLAAMLCLFSAFVERWLFFAEARHMVMAYYER